MRCACQCHVQCYLFPISRLPYEYPYSSFREVQVTSCGRVRQRLGSLRWHMLVCRKLFRRLGVLVSWGTGSLAFRLTAPVQSPTFCNMGRQPRPTSGLRGALPGCADLPDLGKGDEKKEGAAGFSCRTIQRSRASTCHLLDATCYVKCRVKAASDVLETSHSVLVLSSPSRCWADVFSPGQVGSGRLISRPFALVSSRPPLSSKLWATGPPGQGKKDRNERNKTRRRQRKENRYKVPAP